LEICYRNIVTEAKSRVKNLLVAQLVVAFLRSGWLYIYAVWKFLVIREKIKIIE